MSSLPTRLSLLLAPIALGLVLLQAWIRLSPLVSLAGKGHRTSSNYFAPSSTDPVALLVFDTTTRYKGNATESNAEWEALMPSGGHVVYVDDELGRPREYTVTLFHQLRCMDIIRREYVQPYPHPPVSPLTQHCLTYLQQSLMCNLNIHIESATNQLGTAVRSYPALCKDWTEVYSEAERNQRQYFASLKP